MMSDVIEEVIPGVSVPQAIRLPDPRSEEEMFPHVVTVANTDRDERAADTVAAISTMVEIATAMDLSGPAAQDALAGLFGDPYFQQLVGMAEKAAA